jgi:hypothetical protein
MDFDEQGTFLYIELYIWLLPILLLALRHPRTEE